MALFADQDRRCSCAAIFAPLSTDFVEISEREELPGAVMHSRRHPALIQPSADLPRRHFLSASKC
jgi:hypothetical protein